GGLVAALLLARLWFGKADLTMALNGALAGLVAITAEPLTPTPLLATAIGAIGGVRGGPSVVTAGRRLESDGPVRARSGHGLVRASMLPLDRVFKIDDPVGAISVHGVVGMWGLLAVCLSNPDASLGAQLLGLVTILAWVFVTSFIAWLVIKSVVGIRVSEQEEYEGVDISECGLEAYPEFRSGRETATVAPSGPSTGTPLPAAGASLASLSSARRQPITGPGCGPAPRGPGRFFFSGCGARRGGARENAARARAASSRARDDTPRAPRRPARDAGTDPP